MRRHERARKCQEPAAVGGRLEAGSRSSAAGVKNASVSAMTCDTQVSARRVRRGSPASRWRRMAVLRNPVESPLERADDAIGGDGGEPAFPGMEEGLKHRPPCYTERLMRTIFDTRKRSGQKRAGRVAACALDH